MPSDHENIAEDDCTPAFLLLLTLKLIGCFYRFPVHLGKRECDSMLCPQQTASANEDILPYDTMALSSLTQRNIDMG